MGKKRVALTPKTHSSKESKVPIITGAPLNLITILITSHSLLRLGHVFLSKLTLKFQQDFDRNISMLTLMKS